MNEAMRQFASDNYAGICPEAWAAMAEANSGSANAYGEDHWTAAAAEELRRLFNTDCEVFFVFNGTAANSLSLAALCQSYHSVICAETAHIATDECGAPEFFSSGMKLLPVPCGGGKLTPRAIRDAATRRSDIHFPKPKLVSVTQSSETGQVYTVAEVEAIGALCRELGLRLHMDGARFANAVAALGCDPAAVTWPAGVDVLCFGGTKNGMAIGEAILFFDREAALDFEYRCKQAGQLASKMRFLAAPWLGMLRGGHWLENARHANAEAQYFATKVSQLRDVQIRFPVDANAVFIQAAPQKLAALRAKGWRFYDFIGDSARFMFSWNSDRTAVDQLIADFGEG